MQIITRPIFSVKCESVVIKLIKRNFVGSLMEKVYRVGNYVETGKRE